MFQQIDTAPHYFRLLAEGATIDDGRGSADISRRSSFGGAAEWGEGSLAGASSPRHPRIIEQDDSLPPGASGSSSSSSIHPTHGSAQRDQQQRRGLDASSPAAGYYSRFFVELKKLGRGASGHVYLCQHVLNGNPLGLYAVKKIACGDDAEQLLRTLKEVHLMETLQHPNVIHYQHAWIEDSRASAFAPEVPTLHVLMMAANGGSLAE